jgi:hypothetical protein
MNTRSTLRTIFQLRLIIITILHLKGHSSGTNLLDHTVNNLCNTDFLRPTGMVIDRTTPNYSILSKKGTLNSHDYLEVEVISDFA